MTEEKKDQKKIGVYICSGCSIGDCIDIEELSKVVTHEYKMSLLKTDKFLCGEEGVNIIKDDIANDGVNAILIAACATRMNYDIFDFGESALVERVDIRERVAWSHEPNDEETLALAQDYLRMGMEKIKAMEAPVAFQVENLSESVMVIGGGITGLTAAKNAADAGRQVFLVEKEKRLGGFMNKLKKTFPRVSPYTSLGENDIEKHISAVESDPGIAVFLGATIESISGGPGMFDVRLVNGSPSSIRVGAIIQATGWKPYDYKKLTELGAGAPDVISNVMFEEMAAKGDIVRPSNGLQARRVVFIQCAGSRDENHLPYCSSVCCAVSLKHALYLREQDPDAMATIIYKDIRTTGNTELFYKKVQEDPGLFLTKGEVTGVVQDGDELVVTADDTLLGETIAVMADLVVLATGMVPAAYDPDVKADKPVDQMQDFDREQVGKASIMNLDYRQGPELPDLKYGFPDSHFICFPYETRRTGIYTAGALRHPQDIGAAMQDAGGAALKAIQCITLTKEGRAVSPRAGDNSYPEFSMERCTQCKRCTVECPFGAINEDEKANPIPFVSRCRRCATCMGACPVQIINFKNYSINMIGNMIKSIDMPDEDTGKLRALAFICENDAMPAVDMAGIMRLKYNSSVRFITLRCLGSMNLVWVADALSAGWDGIMMIGCKHGDDYQCHNIKGSELAEYRAEKVQETLDRLVLESERVQVTQLAINEYWKIPEIMDGFMETLSDLDPNPYKGF